METIVETRVLTDQTQYKIDFENKTDGLLLLKDLLTSSIPTAFFYPLYRGVLDKLHYGNEGRGRGQQRCALPQMSEDTIHRFILRRSQEYS